MNDNLRHLHALIGRTRLREALARSLRAFSYIVPAGAAVATFAVVAFSLEWIGRAALDVTLIAVIALAAVLAAAYVVAGLATRRLAVLLDRRADLKDRLQNALEFQAKPAPTPLMVLAMADADEHAAHLAPRALVPLWQREMARPLAVLLLLAPLLYAAAVIHLADWFREPPTDFLGAVQRQMPAELAEDGFRDLPPSAAMLPALAGFRGAITDWRARLTQLRERARQIARTGPDREPILPETIYREDLAREGGSHARQILAADGLPAVQPTDQLHLSDMRAMGDIDAQVDASMAKAFEQLDQTLLDKDPNLESVQQYVDSVRSASAKGKQSGALSALQAEMGTNMGAENDGIGAFRNKTQAAQQQSFNEFLQEYAAHLGRAVETKREVNDKRAEQKKDDGNTHRVLVSDQGQELPPDAELRMVKMNEAMRRGVKLDPGVGQQQDQPIAGSSRAGRGGGTFRGAIKVKHQADLGTDRQEKLTGEAGDGRSRMQIIEDVETDRQAYDQLVAEFNADAQQRLQDPTIPAAIRAFVQRYLASIGAAQADQQH